MEWVPFVIVVGQKELDSGLLPVRDRLTGKMRNMKPEDLVEELKALAEDRPFKPLPLPMYLSKRPQFYG
jgi:threonyl-tRNA synthetase